MTFEVNAWVFVGVVAYAIVVSMALLLSRAGTFMNDNDLQMYLWALKTANSDLAKQVMELKEKAGYTMTSDISPSPQPSPIEGEGDLIREVTNESTQ